jgi:FeS assembly protein SufD
MAGLLSAAAPDPEALTRDARQTLATPLGRELWKYTPTQTFVDAIAAAAPRPGVILRGGGQPGVTVHPIDEAHGVAWLAETVARQRQPERYPLTDMAWSRARGGWLIRVAGRTEVPIEVDYDEAGVAPLVLRVEPGASLTLIERTAAEGFLAQPTLIAIEAGARLDHQRHALTSEHGHYASLNVRLADRAHYRLNHNVIGGRRRRAEVHVRIDGREAEVELSGAYVVEAGTHLDQQVVVEHCSPGSVSRQKFHGIGVGKGRSAFNGRIHIHPGASGSDATLSNRNLAMHPDAEMNTKPELEIYNDDVRCAHGATVGQLGADSLFYLTSRGIPAIEARRLLSHGFLRECLWGSELDAAAERLLAALT